MLHLLSTPASCTHPRTGGSDSIPQTLPAPTAVSAHSPARATRSVQEPQKPGASVAEGPISPLPTEQGECAHTRLLPVPACGDETAWPAGEAAAGKGAFPGHVPGGRADRACYVDGPGVARPAPPSKVSVGRHLPSSQRQGGNLGLRTVPHGLVPGRWAHRRPSNKVGALRSGGKGPGAGGVCAPAWPSHLCPRSHPGPAGLGHSPAPARALRGAWSWGHRGCETPCLPRGWAAGTRNWVFQPLTLSSEPCSTRRLAVCSELHRQRLALGTRVPASTQVPPPDP